MEVIKTEPGSYQPTAYDGTCVIRQLDSHNRYVVLKQTNNELFALERADYQDLEALAVMI